MTKLKTDEKTIFISPEYNGPSERDFWKSEIRATADGLYVDGNYVIPWDWILEAMAASKREDNTPSKE